ncbi:hypothetical protein AAE478_007067 [Parahypoxylon ruwenzoriense]
MSTIRIALDNPPEFYTNLDFISGRVILGLQKHEVLGNVIVKLEGESRTALTVPVSDRDDLGRRSIVTENHKILYRVFQVYPDDGVALSFHPGQHEFKFNFKVPLNTICYDPKAMSSLLGVGGVAGPVGAFGFTGGGFRTMDGTKQLMLRHIKATLPPSLTGFPREAEIRYYIKVTIQRPGFFKENWRHEVGFKFLPIEPPRPTKTKQEAFARRPFTFQPRAPAHHYYKKSFLFGSRSSSPPISPNEAGQIAPSIEMSARIPFPSILTCNGPLPLRLIARKLAPTQEQVFLRGVEVVLVGYTQVRVQNLENTERTTWIIVSTPPSKPLSIALGLPTDPVNTEFEIPSDLWRDCRLPNTVAPSFRTCNLARRYEIEIILTLSWVGSASSLPGPKNSSSSLFSSKNGQLPLFQTIQLPLKLSRVDVFSGIRPPQELVDSVATGVNRPPQPPPRPSTAVPPICTMQGQRPPQRPSQGGPSANIDPLYPPQLGTGMAMMYDDAPPSYDEAMADRLAGPAARPAYSGVTAENAPSTMPAEKS